MNLYKSNQFLFVFLLLLLQSCAFSQEVPDVCITRTGEKYHQCTCRYLKYSSFQISLTEATQRGYTPCSVCKPPIPQDNPEPVAPPQPDEGTVKKASPKTDSVGDGRCTATTKAGTRCKRAAAAGSAKCWQHQ